MYEYERISTWEEKVKSITCDICKTQYDDVMELQEMLNFQALGGYQSIFGDGTLIELDICQYCLKDKLGNYIRLDDKETENIPHSDGE